MFIDKKISSQALYERQLKLVQNKVESAPDIICCDLKTPENIASIFRVADAVGSQKVVLLSDNGILLDYKKIKKISRSSDYINCESHVLSVFKSTVPLIGIELTELSQDVFNTELPKKTAFVIGNERHGIKDEILQQCEQVVHIPMYGINGSMNVSHALAIVMYEWRRQHSR